MKALVLEGEINAQMTAKLLKFCVSRWYALERPIVDIWLNTEGGETQQAKEMYNLIKADGAIRIIAFGECASAGTIILQAAKERWSTEACSFLVHYGTETNETAQERKLAGQELKWMKAIYNGRVKVSKQTVGRWMNRDAHMTAERALKVGLIDGILNDSYRM